MNHSMPIEPPVVLTLTLTCFDSSPMAHLLLIPVHVYGADGAALAPVVVSGSSVMTLRRSSGKYLQNVSRRLSTVSRSMRSPRCAMRVGSMPSCRHDRIEPVQVPF